MRNYSRRDLLHLRDVPEFKHWLLGLGYVEMPLSNAYEIMRVRKPLSGRKSRHVIIYQKGEAKEHATIHGDDVALVKQFLRDRK
jgi:hypothetical protein